MTVRAKTELHRALAATNVAGLWVMSNIVGEVQVQVIGAKGEMLPVFVPSSAGLERPRWVNLLDTAPATAWKKSRSLMAAVRANHIYVTLKAPPTF